LYFVIADRNRVSSVFRGCRVSPQLAPLLKRAEKFAVRPMVEPKPLKARKDPLDIR
jgi:hypothetical protein